MDEQTSKNRTFERNDTERRVRDAADLLVRHRFRVWFYGDSIGFEALLAAAALLWEPRYAGFCHGFFRAWAARSEPHRESDNTAPGHAICRAYEETGDDAVLDAALRLARFLLSRRRVDGVFAAFEETPLQPPYGPVTLEPHEVALLGNGGPAVFVDCLHFDPPFLAHLAHLTADAGLMDAALDQALGYVRLLQDEGTGLFYHFWLERTRRPYVLGWSRGQGWALLGLIDVLDYAPPEDPRRQLLAESVLRLARGLATTQREDGHWFAVAPTSTSGDETSTAAFAAAGLPRAAGSGLIDRVEFDGCIRRARSAMWEAVDDRGMLHGVSAAVGSSTNAAHYSYVPTGFLVPWGQGPLILAAVEEAAEAADGGA